MATGLGKTIVFTSIADEGTLVLSHREELRDQPKKYNKRLTSETVQTMIRRLDHYDPCQFHTIVWDEAHHCAAKTYKTIYNHFKPRVHLGFTATPGRGDGVSLQGIFDEIIFSRDLRWGIENEWLVPIECVRVNVGYDIEKVKTQMGDLSLKELEKAVNIESANKAIAEAVQNLSQKPVLIFATTIKHAEDIAALIPGAVVRSGKEKDRSTNHDVIVNCALFTEGVDIPQIKTVIIARPTKSATLYAQMVGRGTRLFPGKKKLILIDCVGVSGRHNLCMAPSLIGLTDEMIPARMKTELCGDLLSQIPERISQLADVPESWIKNIHHVKLWAAGSKYNLHNVNWYRMPDGALHLGLGSKRWIKILPEDSLGRTRIQAWNGNMSDLLPFQTAIDKVTIRLRNGFDDARPLWDTTIFKRWGNEPATGKQLNLIHRMRPDIKMGLTKGEACQILNRLTGGRV
jgi:hypothetical protein